MFRIFIGYDARQSASYNVCQYSIISQSSQVLAITPLVLEQLPIKRSGLTPFTFSRFLVPHLCDYKGWALFMDADMLVCDDICKLLNFADDKFAIRVCRQSLDFEDCSLMLFNCGHKSNQALTPLHIENSDDIFDLDWLDKSEVGDLPLEWNHLVGYDNPRPDAKIIHFTQGIPSLTEMNDCEHASKWHDFAKRSLSVKPWLELMGKSYHAVDYDGMKIPRYLIDSKTGQPLTEHLSKIEEIKRVIYQ